MVGFIKNFKAGQTIRFTYASSREDKFKEVFVIHPNWQGKLHAIDLKRLTEAERHVINEIMEPDAKKKKHDIPLINDILTRMNPTEDIKNPVSFYQKFVKVFLRNKDAYRVYSLSKMTNAQIVQKTEVEGKTFNPKPLFKKI